LTQEVVHNRMLPGVQRRFLAERRTHRRDRVHGLSLKAGGQCHNLEGSISLFIGTLPELMYGF
jgi:hypothetical protein